MRDESKVTSGAVDLDPAAFHGVAGRIVQSIAPHSEADPAALLLTVLTRSAAAIGASAFLPVSAGGSQPPRLYALLVGSSARARKGTAEADVSSIFSLADPYFHEERTRSGMASGEGLIKHLSREHDDLGQREQSLLIIEPEFARVLTAANREGSTLSAIIRDLYDRGAASVLTRMDPLHVDHAHLCIVAHTTHEELRSRMRAVDVANGFANRFLIIRVHRARRLPHGGSLTDHDREELGSLWAAALARGRSVTGRIGRTPEAAAAWEAFYYGLDDDVSGMHGSLIARAEAHVARLSLVYALLDGSKLIDVEHTRAALALWDYAEQSIRSLYPPTLTTGNPDADRILEAVRERGRMTKQEVSQLFSAHRTSEQLDNALGLLIERTVIDEKVEFGTGGRPRTVFIYLGEANA